MICQNCGKTDILSSDNICPGCNGRIYIIIEDSRYVHSFEFGDRCFVRRFSKAKQEETNFYEIKRP